ncbi:MAG: recombinase family protein [Bacteroidales bacterium]|nr:recombinase family protein [Bacteroidales bacterium]
MNNRNINVILYTRVSTDEQADGCSIEMQERYLNAYCSNHGYNVVETYYEDYSAKHYDMRRPEIKKIYD